MVKKWMKACCLVAAMIGTAHAAQQTYVVGSGGTYRPFEFENSQKQLEGFDIDLIAPQPERAGHDLHDRGQPSPVGMRRAYDADLHGCVRAL